MDPQYQPLSGWQSEDFLASWYKNMTNGGETRQDLCEPNGCRSLIQKSFDEGLAWYRKLIIKKDLGQRLRHVYPHVPFSEVKYLRLLFEKQRKGIGGNFNTINVASLNNKKALEEGKFESSLAGNFKEVIDFGAESYFSIDTGVSESVFSKHNFDMNKAHTNNDLTLIRSHLEDFEGVGYTTEHFK